MRFNVCIFIGLLVLAVFCLASLTANATVVVKLSDEAMVNKAGTIVTGRVVAVRSEWNEDRTKIYTYITVVPQEFLKGNESQNEIVIKQPGGEVGDIGMHVEGISVFEENEDVLLFLRKGQRRFHRIIGFSQGKFSIEIDPDTKRKALIKKKIRRIRTSDGRIGRRTIAITSDRKLFLDDFRINIQNIINQQQKSN